MKRVSLCVLVTTVGVHFKTGMLNTNVRLLKLLTLFDLILAFLEMMNRYLLISVCRQHCHKKLALLPFERVEVLLPL